MKRALNKKGYSIGDIPYLVIVFAVGIIAASIIGQIVGETGKVQCEDVGGYWNGGYCKNSSNDNTYRSNSDAANISQKGGAGVLKIANWFTTIGLVIGAVIVITALGALFVMGKK